MSHQQPGFFDDIFDDIDDVSEAEAAGAARLSTYFAQEEAGLWRSKMRRRLQRVALQKGCVTQAARLWAQVKGEAGLKRLSLHAGGASVRQRVEGQVALLESLEDADLAKQAEIRERLTGANKVDEGLVKRLAGRARLRPRGLCRR